MTRIPFPPRNRTSLDCRDRGDTLVEVLVAVVIIGLAVVALLGTLLTTTSASVVHRATSSFDSYVSNFAEAARNQIQLQASNGGSGPTFTACTVGGPAVNYKLVGNPIPQTAPAGASVALLGSGFLPTSASITGASGAGTPVNNFSTTPTSTSSGFIAQFNIPSLLPAGSYTISLNSGANSYSAASEFDISSTASPPYTTPTFSNSYDAFSVTLSYWNGSWTTTRASCTGPNFNPNIQQLKIGLAHAQPNNGSDSLGTIVVSNLSPQGLSAPPASVSASTPSGASGTIKLSWFTPTFQGSSSVTSYNVYRSTVSGSQGTSIASVGPCASPNPCNYTDNNGGSGLANSSLYYYEVTAVNTVGESAPSNQATGTTLPGAPTGFSVTRGNAQATLSWSAPSPTGNAPLTGYKVYRGPDNTFAHATVVTSGACASPLPVTTTTCIDSGLTNGTPYFYWVSAVNSGGEGTATGPISVTPGTVPSAPQNLTVAPTNTSGQLTVSWSVPASNGGSALSGYKVYRGPDTTFADATLVTTGACASPVPAGTLTCTDSGLTNGTTYNYFVTAVNGVGEGSPAGPATREAGLPGAPTGLSVTSHGKVGSNGFVNLSWTPPSANGGSTVTYNVYVSTTAGTQGSLTANVTFSGTTAHVTNLNTGSTYFFVVTAVNTVGEGPPSNQTTPGVKP